MTTETITRESLTLADWNAAIAELDTALRDAGLARAAIDEANRTLERIEAGHTLAIEGGNAEQRSARLTLALADDDRYQAHQAARATARDALFSAERRVQVAKERCRLFRAALTPGE